MSYDTNNVFAKIIRNEIPCNKVYDDDFCLAFYDLQPAAPIHIIVIPKSYHRNFHDFSTKATPNEINGFFRGVTSTLAKLSLTNDDGYRLITNSGENGLQSVDHFHIHILAGEKLGPLVVKDLHHK